MRKEDLRVARTRKLLCNTLLDMMEEQPIEKISVIDLCERAMVNRATFYAHFEDKYHLLNFALEELKDDLYARFRNSSEFGDPLSATHSLLNMAIDFFYDKNNHICNIIKYNRGGKIISTIQDSIAQSIKYQLGKFKDNYDFLAPLSVISSFIAGGMISTALLCIDNPGKYSYDSFKGYVYLLRLDSYFLKKRLD